VAEVTRKSVRVVPTTTIPEGIAALLAFDPGMDLEACALAMEEGSRAVRTGEVTEAVRGVDLNGVEVRPGQLIGLLDRELVAAGDELSGVVESVVRMAGASDGDMVTLYWGEPVTEGVAKKVTEDVAAALPRAEFELVAGGQPHYHFYVSVE
jgi:dihydroxyacetone kinase-like predicted kinase